MPMENASMPRAAVITLGCRVNQYESEAIEAELLALGFEVVPPNEKCQVYIINTCAVTGESERKSRQMIRRAAKNGAYVLVTGCYSQIKAKEAASLPSVFYVCGTRNKRSAAEMAASLVLHGADDRGAKIAIPKTEGDDAAPLELLPFPHSHHTRAYVKIEDGCDNHCTYCIIRKARGRVVSRAEDAILSEMETLARNGTREVVLTGIETASYGKDTGTSLLELLPAAARVEGIERIRLGSLEPTALSPAFCNCIAAEKKMMPSFHLSLQSGSSRILALMKRRYNREQVLCHVEYLRSLMPNVTFTCDVIVGFPGETEEDFLDTVDLVRQIGFLHMHIFPFSPREGTEAASMPSQVNEAVKSERLHRLEAVGREITERLYRAAIGAHRSVLFETYENGVAYGHSEDMLEIKMQSEVSPAGRIYDAVVTDYDGTYAVVSLA